MKKLVIGIVSKTIKKHKDDLWHRMNIVDELRYLVVANGGIVIALGNKGSLINIRR